MTWDDTDRTELDEYVDEIEQNAYDLGVMIGKGLERQRIIELLKGSVMTENMEWIVSLVKGENE